MNEVENDLSMRNIRQTGWNTLPLNVSSVEAYQESWIGSAAQSDQEYSYGREIRRGSTQVPSDLMGKIVESPAQSTVEYFREARDSAASPSPVQRASRWGGRLMGAAEAIRGTGEVLVTYRDDAADPQSNYRNTMSKIIGITLGTVSTGLAASGAAAVLAGGITLAAAGGAVVIVGAGAVCAWGLYEASPRIVAGLEGMASAATKKLSNF